MLYSPLALKHVIKLVSRFNHQGFPVVPVAKNCYVEYGVGTDKAVGRKFVPVFHPTIAQGKFPVDSVVKFPVELEIINQLAVKVYED